jgi:putative peptidoglycan lipid II flippase
VQTNTSADLASSANSDLAQQPGMGIARGAALVAGLTVLSRLLGLARTLVFSQSIGAGCLGSAYVTANQVPSLIYELVLGGALTTAMVPVLARSAARAASDPAEKARVGQITSAMLTWSVLILVPATLLIVAVAGPIASALTPANANAQCVHAEVVATTRNMLQVFAPQAALYGLSVVLFGLLQAYRRFTAPVLAPLVSSLVLIAAYLAFVPLDKGLPLGRMPVSAELVLSVGTTLGIAALVLTAVVPVWRLHLRFRPALRMPSGVARRVGGLAIVGVIELIAIDVSNLVAIALANGRGTTGAIVIFNYVGQVFNTLAAALGGAIVFSAFPALCSRDGSAFDETSAGSTRAVLLASWLGTAVIAAVAVPAAHVLAKQPDQVPQLIEGFALMAPGLVGIGVIANLSRVMFATRHLKIAAAALAGSCVLMIAADVILAELAPARLVVAALALGATIGQTLVAIPLVIATRRTLGRKAVQGVAHTALTGLAAAAAGAGAGIAVGIALPVSHKLLAACIAVLAAGSAVIAFAVVAYILDDGDLRTALARLREAVVLRRVTGQRMPDRAPR